MKQHIKRTLTSNKAGHRALCEQKILRQKLRLHKKEQEADKIGTKIYSVNNLQKNRAEEHTSCHIIGSGWSLAESMVLARKKDAYTVGFNFSCLSGLEFDAYFIEFGGPKCADIAEKQKDSLSAFQSNIKGHLLFKNLWEEKNEIGYATRLYRNEATFIRDISIPCFHERYLDVSASLYLKPDWTYLRQYKSSALTAINFARYLGFRQIVLHGIDFGGGYFFDLPGFSHVRELTPPQTNSLAYNQNTRANQHPTARTNTGIDQMLPFVEKALRDEGTQIYAATRSSPLSGLLPVFADVK